MADHPNDPFTDRAYGADPSNRATPRTHFGGSPNPGGPYMQPVGNIGSQPNLPYASATTLGQPEPEYGVGRPGYDLHDDDESRPLTEGQGFSGGFYPPTYVEFTDLSFRQSWEAAVAACQHASQASLRIVLNLIWLVISSLDDQTPALIDGLSQARTPPRPVGGADRLSSAA